jgi:glutamate-1-semialdehyde 2,1-aminomutase
MFGTDDWFIGTTPMAAGIPEAVRQLTVGFAYNDVAGLAELLDRHRGRIAAVVLEAETTEPPTPGFLPGLRRLCDRHGTLLILDEIITGFRWHERGAQFVHDVLPDLSTFGKAMGNGFPVSALVGRRDVMRLGGPVDDVDRVFLLSQTGSAQPWALAAVLAVIDTYQQSAVADRLHRIGADLRAGVEGVVADAGLESYVQLKGRDCNMVYVARDGEGRASQAFRTLLLQELLQRGVLAPSLVVSAAHDPQAVDHTVSAFADAMTAYRRALDHGVGTVLRGRPVAPAVRTRG